MCRKNCWTTRPQSFDVRACISALVVLAAAVCSGCGSSGDRDACKRFLGCVAEVSPDQLPGLLETYGAGGTCWQASEISAGCGDHCRTRLRDAAVNNVSVKVNGDQVDFEVKYRSCVECQGDAHCTDDARPGCHVGAGLCVQCTTDLHCQTAVPAVDDEAGAGLFSDLLAGENSSSLAGKSSSNDSSRDNVHCDESGTVCVTIEPDENGTSPGQQTSGADRPLAAALQHCAVDRGVCVECRTDGHCTDPQYPRCSRASGLCSACSEDAHCPADKPVCVVAASPFSMGDYVVGARYGYAGDQASGSGGGAGRNYCTGCRDSDDCGGDTPVCDPVQARCVQCRHGGDCGDSGTCNLETGRCEQSCSEVMACMESECAYGCADPNALCGMLQCDNAKALAQCIANHCVDCYKTGWRYYSYSSSFDCESCIYDWCSAFQDECYYNGC